MTRGLMLLDDSPAAAHKDVSVARGEVVLKEGANRVGRDALRHILKLLNHSPGAHAFLFVTQPHTGSALP
jgi:hypothetical protein